jgi:hypothetical protein
MIKNHDGNDSINQNLDDTTRWRLQTPMKNDDTSVLNEFMEK